MILSIISICLLFYLMVIIIIMAFTNEPLIMFKVLPPSFALIPTVAFYGDIQYLHFTHMKTEAPGN